MDGNMYSTNDGSALSGIFMMLFFFGVYFYFAFAQFKIAQKIGHQNEWFAFVPILNLVQLIQLAGKSMLWFLFMFIPFVNIFCFVSIWMEIAKRTGKSAVVGFLTIIPIVSFFTIGMMAFGSSGSGSDFAPPSESKPHQPAGVA